MADTPLTIAKARVSPLTNPERLGGFTHKFKVLYSDIACGTGATDTVTLTLGSAPPGAVIDKCMVRINSSFVGTGTQTVSVQIGNGTNASAFIGINALIATAANTILQPSNGKNAVLQPANATSTSTQTMKATFTNAAAGSPSALTAGDLDIYLSVLDTSTLRFP